MDMTTALGSTLAELRHRIESRQARIGIVGMGYVGLPLALLFSDEKFRVTGFDIAADKVSTLNSGGSYIVRILPAEIQKARESGFRATSDYSEIAAMDAVIICVPTPLNEYHEPDLSYVTGTVKSIAPHIHEGNVDAAIDVLEQLGHLGDSGAADGDDPAEDGAIDSRSQFDGRGSAAAYDLGNVVAGHGVVPGIFTLG